MRLYNILEAVWKLPNTVTYIRLLEEHNRALRELLELRDIELENLYGIAERYNLEILYREVDLDVDESE
jgi:hypothetical protein